ncbi:hypothetical protein [Halorientalis halophila]|uniref:hypothetical protein n=1 Tax=Halorientalis halophila TaxID=3108499 RepID=UPI00300B1C68
MAGLVDIVTSLPDLARFMTDVALSDPISAVLLALGTLFFAVTIGFTGYLALGATISGILPDLSGGQPPRAR